VADIEVGDLFWDREHVWSADRVNACYFVICKDPVEPDGPAYWHCSLHPWVCGKYCGGPVRHFTDSEMARMVRVGNISSLMSFPNKESS